MIKKYCDICDEEMDFGNTPNLGRNGAILIVPVLSKVKLEIKSISDEKVDVCINCAINAIKEYKV